MVQECGLPGRLGGRVMPGRGAGRPDHGGRVPQAAPCLRRSSRFLALLAGGVLALLPTPGRAQTTVQVTTLADSGPGSLRAVLAAAPSGATVLFAPGLSGT